MPTMYDLHTHTHTHDSRTHFISVYISSSSHFKCNFILTDFLEKCQFSFDIHEFECVGLPSCVCVCVLVPATAATANKYSITFQFHVHRSLYAPAQTQTHTRVMSWTPSCIFIVYFLVSCDARVIRMRINVRNAWVRTSYNLHKPNSPQPPLHTVHRPQTNWSFLLSLFCCQRTRRLCDIAYRSPSHLDLDARAASHAATSNVYICARRRSRRRNQKAKTMKLFCITCNAFIVNLKHAIFIRFIFSFWKYVLLASPPPPPHPPHKSLLTPITFHMRFMLLSNVSQKRLESLVSSHTSFEPLESETSAKCAVSSTKSQCRARPCWMSLTTPPYGVLNKLLTFADFRISSISTSRSFTKRSACNIICIYAKIVRRVHVMCVSTRNVPFWNFHVICTYQPPAISHHHVNWHT